MVRQFLLNPDGSIPPGTNIALLMREGIPLVMPTARPRAPGMIAVERAPAPDEHGVLRQVWTLEPAPPPPEPEPAFDAE